VRCHPRFHVIDTGAELLLCRGRTRLRLAGAGDVGIARRLLDWLASPSTEPPVRGPDIMPFLGMLAELERHGLVTAASMGGDIGDDWIVPDALPPGPQVQLAGRRVTVLGHGELASQIGDAFSNAGALVEVVGPAPGQPEAPVDVPGADLVIAGPSGPDLALLARANDLARGAGAAYLPVFHIGDEGIAGPLAVAGRSACFRCWELRWLGLAESTTAELALHAHLRAGGWTHETRRSPGPLRYLAESALRVAAAGLGADQPDGLVWVADFRAGQAAGHVAPPHPGCGRCAPVFQEPEACAESVVAAAAAVADADTVVAPGGAVPASSSLADLAPLTDHRLGAAALEEFDSDEPGQPAGRTVARMSIAHARFASAHPEQMRSDAEHWTHGAASTPDEARLVALVEALERYCGTFVPRPAVTAAFDTVADAALWPPDLPLYSSRQYAQPGFPFRPFDPHEPMAWGWAWNVVRECPQLVPQAALRYGPGESTLLHANSSGVAAHTSAEAALLGATLEVVERDALMIFWLNRLSPPLLTVEGIGDQFVAAAAQELRLSGYALRLADLTTDIGIPVVLAIATREDHAAPALVLGAGAALDPVRAATKALRELLGATRGWLQVEWTPPVLLDPGEVRGLSDHARAYYHPNWLARAAFLWSSPERRALSAWSGAAPATPGQQLAACVDRLRSAGLELLAADLTTPDVGRTPVRVVRALVPDMQPIGFGPDGLRLGGRRLYTSPIAMGYAEVERTEESLNPDPHCYP